MPQGHPINKYRTIWISTEEFDLYSAKLLTEMNKKTGILVYYYSNWIPSKFKQTHGHQKLDKPKKKKIYYNWKLETVQTLTEKNIQNWKDLKLKFRKKK